MSQGTLRLEIDRAAESANQTYCLSLLLSTEDGGSDHCLNEVLFTEGGEGFIWGRYHQGVPDASDHLEVTSSRTKAHLRTKRRETQKSLLGTLTIEL